MSLVWQRAVRVARQRSACTTRAGLSHRHASRIEIPFSQPAFPVIPTCPAPTCDCRQSPVGLDIDRDGNLNGLMAAYAEQILISTGRSDWKSRIEDDEDAVLLRRMKGLLGRGGKYSDPYHNVLLTNSSFHPSAPEQQLRPEATSVGTQPKSVPADPSFEAAGSASAYLLPSFRYVPTITTTPAGVEDFVQAFVLPETQHPAYEQTPADQRLIRLRQTQKQDVFPGACQVQHILVLICGHGGRDERCGIYGPLLQDEFEDQLQRQGIEVLRQPPGLTGADRQSEPGTRAPSARVGLISHIGGHKFAGNVIIYIPPTLSANPLAGRGIWYGRVGPEQVEGIVRETILRGQVIQELFRGGIDQHRNLLRI